MIPFKIDSSFMFQCAHWNPYTEKFSLSNEEALKQGREMLDKELEFLIECGSHLEGRSKKEYIEHLRSKHKLAVEKLAELAKQSKITGEELLTAAHTAVAKLSRAVGEFVSREEMYEQEKGSVHERLDDFDRHLEDSNPSFDRFEEYAPFADGLPSTLDMHPHHAQPYSDRFSEIEKTAVGSVVQQWVETAEIFKRALRNQLVEQITSEGNEILKELQDLEKNGMNHLREDHLKLAIVRLKMSGLLFLQNLPENPLDQESKV